MCTCEPGGEDEKNSCQQWDEAEQLNRLSIIHYIDGDKADGGDDGNGDDGNGDDDDDGNGVKC